MTQSERLDAAIEAGESPADLDNEGFDWAGYWPVLRNPSNDAPIVGWVGGYDDDTDEMIHVVGNDVDVWMDREDWERWIEGGGDPNKFTVEEAE